jgi:hypothetical protein
MVQEVDSNDNAVDDVQHKAKGKVSALLLLHRDQHVMKMCNSCTTMVGP